MALDSEKLARIRLVCFDLDDTFWEVGPVIERADAAVDAWLRGSYPELALHADAATLRAARQRLALQEPARAHDLTWLRIEALARIAERCGAPRSVGAQAFEIFIAERNRVELFPDVEPALNALAPRYRLATLSNGNADLQRIGLASRFEFSLHAGAIGVAKPDPRAFHAVVAHGRLAPHEVLYVGDDPAHDIDGARAAGLRTAWVCRSARPAGTAPSLADLTVGDLRALAAALNCASR
ncbi:MAG: HAD family hydrolase [Steroidobacteraceae bacterium]|nr:HAD family hydrolase [Steroidobacteraceae bacterium]MDW8259869.1 HAD family hydrolase [Gammaproteobacteria bacterium]